MKFLKSGREQRLNPKRGTRGGWCHGCDETLVRKGEICPVCGRVDTTRRKMKKPYPPIE